MGLVAVKVGVAALEGKKKVHMMIMFIFPIGSFVALSFGRKVAYCHLKNIVRTTWKSHRICRLFVLFFFLGGGVVVVCENVLKGGGLPFFRIPFSNKSTALSN